MDLKVTTDVATGLKDEDRKRDILMNAREEGLRVHTPVRRRGRRGPSDTVGRGTSRFPGYGTTLARTRSLANHSGSRGNRRPAPRPARPGSQGHPLGPHRHHHDRGAVRDGGRSGGLLRVQAEPVGDRRSRPSPAHASTTSSSPTSRTSSSSSTPADIESRSPLPRGSVPLNAGSPRAQRPQQ